MSGMQGQCCSVYVVAGEPDETYRSSGSCCYLVTTALDLAALVRHLLPGSVALGKPILLSSEALHSAQWENPSLRE